MRSVNIPDELYRKAPEIAKEQQTSVETVIASAFSQYLALVERFQRRAARGNREEFLAVLDRVPDVDPPEMDRI